MAGVSEVKPEYDDVLAAAQAFGTSAASRWRGAWSATPRLLSRNPRSERRTVRSVAVLGLFYCNLVRGGTTAASAEPLRRDAKCDLKPTNVLVNQGMLYLKSANDGALSRIKRKRI